MFIIATDEAGYGPKLGPLVIAATSWKLSVPGLSRSGTMAIESNVETAGEQPAAAMEEILDQAFQPLGTEVLVGDRAIRVDDSKAIYRPSSKSGGSGLDALHCIVSATAHACGKSWRDLEALLRDMVPLDIDAINSTPWLGGFADQSLVSQSMTADAVDLWSTGGIQLADVGARVVTAKRFNEICDQGSNKADLLSQNTLELVRSSVEQASDDCIRVYCDRHGGRRYYAAVISHVFPEGHVRVISESKSLSVYRCDWKGKEIQLAFTVKGDRFAPVALASINAKYLRERMMESMNRYFASKHRGEEPLKPTAGYPVDADRFLEQIQPIINRERIQRSSLVRQR